MATVERRIAIYCRDEDAYWTGQGQAMRSTAWTPDPANARLFGNVFAEESHLTIDRELLRLTADGWAVMAVILPAADYHLRQNAGDGKSGRPTAKL